VTGPGTRGSQWAHFLLTSLRLRLERAPFYISDYFDYYDYFLMAGATPLRSPARHRLLIDYIKQARLAKLSNGASGALGTDPASGDNFIRTVSAHNADWRIGHPTDYTGAARVFLISRTYMYTGAIRFFLLIYCIHLSPLLDICGTLVNPLFFLLIYCIHLSPLLDICGTLVNPFIGGRGAVRCQLSFHWWAPF
jgi:hypothetical protein